MKRFKLLTILFIGIVILSGCSKTKKSITAQEFYEAADKQGIVVQDLSQHYGIAKKAYQSENNDNKYSILFIEGNSINEMQNMFYDEAKNIYAKAGIKDQYDSQEAGKLTTKAPKKYVLSGKNWESLEVTTDNKYYYLIFIDETLLYMESDNDNKDLVNKLKDTIKY